MMLGRWDSAFDEDAATMRYSLGIEEQARLTLEAMRAMEEKITRDAVIQYLRDQGWTVEPPRRTTEESLTERGTPTVFSRSYRIISLSRGNGDATLDLTVGQALLVAEQLVDWADYYDEYQ